MIRKLLYRTFPLLGRTTRHSGLHPIKEFPVLAPRRAALLRRRAQRRADPKPLAHYARHSADPKRAMALASQSGGYPLTQIAHPGDCDRERRDKT